MPLLAIDAALIVTSPVPPKVPVLLSAPVRLMVVALLWASASIKLPLLVRLAAVMVVVPWAWIAPVLLTA